MIVPARPSLGAVLPIFYYYFCSSEKYNFGVPHLAEVNRGDMFYPADLQCRWQTTVNSRITEAAELVCSGSPLSRYTVKSYADSVESAVP